MADCATRMFSRTVCDLVVGSGTGFEDRGIVGLRGVPGRGETGGGANPRPSNAMRRHRCGATADHLGQHEIHGCRGDTLSALASRFYGDASLYPLIATVNGIADPDVIDIGQVLVIFVGRSDGFGLSIVERNENDPRLCYCRFQTSAIGWNPGVNVLLPDDYRTSGRTYPVLYLFHGGGTDQDFRTFDFLGIRDLTAGKPIIVVMPDGGHAGWYSNPVSSFGRPGRRYGRRAQFPAAELRFADHLTRLQHGNAVPAEVHRCLPGKQDGAGVRRSLLMNQRP